MIFNEIQPDISHVEYWYYNMRPWMHYIPFTKVTQIVDVLNNRDVLINKMETIANNSFIKIRQVYTNRNIKCFTVNMFNFYANLWDDS